MLPEELELQRLESEQATLEEQIANAELTLETLKVETAQFQHRYFHTVGRLYVELDRLEAQIACAKAGLAPNSSEAQAQAEAAEQQAQKSAEEAGLAENQPSISILPELTPELKRAFREAAKLMHPDRATTHSERERRTALMAQVNVAYEKGDLAAIEKLINEFGRDPEAITGEDVASRLIKAIRRIAQLRRRLAEAEQEIADRKAGGLYELMVTVIETEALGGDPLDNLARQIMQQISERKVELAKIQKKRRLDFLQEVNHDVQALPEK